MSGVPAIGGTRGLDSGGEAAAPRGERLTASVFRASWTLGLAKSCLLGNFINGA